MSEPGRPLRPGRGSRSRPSPATLGVVKVDADFEKEYPGGDATSTEAYASLCRTGEALLAELDRRIRLTFDVPQAAATALAVIDGAGEPLTPSQVSERVLIASATMTATLDLLEQRGWIRRIPNPADRRSVLVEITPAGRAATDQLLPGIRALERGIMSALTPGERAQLLDMLAKVLARTAEVAADQQPEPLGGPRVRPARLGQPAGSLPARGAGDPDRDVGGLDGVVDGGGKLVLDGGEVDRLAEAAGEGGHRGLGVVAGAVEAPVHDALDPLAQRVEQRGRGERSGRDRHR